MINRDLHNLEYEHEHSTGPYREIKVICDGCFTHKKFFAYGPDRYSKINPNLGPVETKLCIECYEKQQ